MSDDLVRERATLTGQQVTELHHALLMRQEKIHERGLDLDLKILKPLPEAFPPLPGCPECQQVPDQIALHSQLIGLDVFLDFAPCGHQFRAREVDILELLATET